LTVEMMSSDYWILVKAIYSLEKQLDQLALQSPELPHLEPNVK